MRKMVLGMAIVCAGVFSFSSSGTAQEAKKAAGKDQAPVQPVPAVTKSSKPRMVEVEEAVWYRLNDNFLKIQSELVKTKADLKIALAELENLRKIKASLDSKQPIMISDVVQQKKSAVHRVQKNESLWKIAFRHYNDPYKWRWLYKANLKQIDDPNLIYPEQVLDVPRY